jgi:putative ABC transport system permease protein
MTVPLAQRNLLHEKGKLALSVAGVGAALTLILLLLGFRAGLYATVSAFANNLGADLVVGQSGVRGMFSANSIVPLSVHADVAAAARAVDAGHILMAGIIFTAGDTKTPVLLVGYEPDTIFGRPWNVGSGRTIASDGEILLDTWLAQRAGIAVGDEIDLLGQRFRVVGLTRETASWMSPYVFVSFEAASTVLGLHGLASYHLLRLPVDGDVGRAIAAVEARAARVDVLTPGDIARADERALVTVLDTPLRVMVAISVVIGTAVMSLTAYIAVSERRREYGVLKAIGATQGHIAWLVMRETTGRALLGFFAGVGGANLAATLIMAVWPQFAIVIQWPTVLQAALLALLMNLAAGWLPIRRLRGIDPVLVFTE